MRKSISWLVILCLVFCLMAGGIQAFAAEDEAEDTASVHDAEWDASVPTEITEEIRALFDEAMEGFVGVSYEPIAVLGQKEDVYCILCKATVVYPGAKPYNALMYINTASGKAQIQNIYELWLDAHSEKKTEETTEVEIDYGSSKLYSGQEMEEAIAQIREEFDTWEGCELHSIAYAGDQCSSRENIKWLNSLVDGSPFTRCMEFTSAFHSPLEQSGAWEPDTEYTDWQWWLGGTADGGWELVTWGY